ncbi:hypothetical protein ACFQ0O_13555 [Saccharopolyspora spinosporotrichia]
MSPSARAVRPPEEATEAERWAMRRAIRLTADPPRRTSPNPYVGCVVLDADGRFAGRATTAARDIRTPRSRRWPRPVGEPPAVPPW